MNFDQFYKRVYIYQIYYSFLYASRFDTSKIQGKREKKEKKRYEKARVKSE